MKRVRSWPSWIVLCVAACGTSPAREQAPEDLDGGPAIPSERDAGEPDGTDDAGADGGEAPLPPDPCAAKEAACPSKTTAAEGGGLVALDRCAFPMRETAKFAEYPKLAGALATLAEPASLAAVLADLNRTATAASPGSVPGAPPGVEIAFRWNAEDGDSTTWIPQGITGSADASATGLVEGRRVVVVSWYYTPPGASTYEKGVRVAFVDVTDPAKPKYRFALLVEPKGSAAAPDYASVRIHAGGLAWYGDLLYVADTGHGFRVFDTSKMLKVATDDDVIGCAGGTCRAGLYKYVIPQVGAYEDGSACDPIFSFVSLDRSTSPPSLLSGEYCSGSACEGPLAGRLFRWPLTAQAHLRAPVSWPSEVLLMGQRQVQGGASRDGLYLLSSSAPAAGGGALYRVKGKDSATSDWLDSPEDLMIDEAHGLVWSLSEAAGDRAVAGAKLSSFPSP